jgi:hypothetical protein
VEIIRGKDFAGVFCNVLIFSGGIYLKSAVHIQKFHFVSFLPLCGCTVS